MEALHGECDAAATRTAALEQRPGRRADANSRAQEQCRVARSRPRRRRGRIGCAARASRSCHGEAHARRSRTRRSQSPPRRQRGRIARADRRASAKLQAQTASTQAEQSGLVEMLAAADAETQAVDAQADGQRIGEAVAQPVAVAGRVGVARVSKSPRCRPSRSSQRCGRKRRTAPRPTELRTQLEQAQAAAGERRRRRSAS